MTNDVIFFFLKKISITINDHRVKFHKKSLKWKLRNWSINVRKKVFNVMSKYGHLKFWKDFHQNWASSSLWAHKICRTTSFWFFYYNAKKFSKGSKIRVLLFQSVDIFWVWRTFENPKCIAIAKVHKCCYQFPECWGKRLSFSST